MIEARKVRVSVGKARLPPMGKGLFAEMDARGRLCFRWGRREDLRDCHLFRWSAIIGQKHDFCMFSPCVLLQKGEVGMAILFCPRPVEEIDASKRKLND